jgi:tetratricopeptide (TPR) repeat protein
MIAFHYTEGNAPERAAPYAFRAGQWAAGLAAWAEAIEFYQQALAVDRDTALRRQILLALGEAHFGAGEMAQASEAMRAALGLADPDSSQADAASLALAQTLLAQARFSEVIALMQAVLAGGRPEFAVQAEMTWGTALSLEGADLEAAAEHLRRAEQLSAAQANPTHLAQTRFELGSLAAQQGDLPRAIGLYRESLAAAQTAAAAAPSGDAAHIRVVLAHNNLAYHLLLLSTTGRDQARTPEVPPPGLAEASEHARAGLVLAQEKGILPMQTYLLSTHGEIALASGDLEAARQYFEEGLSLAERLAMPERIAGLTANLGLLARRRGQTDLAIHHLSTALSQADALGTRHLAAQIRLWLAPLLPSAQARQYLAEARLIAESSGRRSLLEEAVRLESEFGRA